MNKYNKTETELQIQKQTEGWERGRGMSDIGEGDKEVQILLENKCQGM